MAEELGVNAHLLNSVLGKYVRDNLELIASDTAGFTGEAKKPIYDRSYSTTEN
jgi:hypothetical protein